MTDAPILVTGVDAGSGNVGRQTASLLLDAGLSVRVMVHHDDGRVNDLRARGAQVAVGDLTDPVDVAAAMSGTRRMLFSMGLVPDYLRAAAVVGTIAAEHADLDAVLNLSQMTVSQMTSTSTAESAHQRLHWLVERILAWAPIPVVGLRPTIFLDNPLFTILPAPSIATRAVLELPIGTGRTSPVASADVARVAAAVLADPSPHVGQIYELTGPEVLDLDGMAAAYGRALGRTLGAEDLPADEVTRRISALPGVSDHLAGHVLTLSALHRAGRYDRLTDTVERITGRRAESVEEFVTRNRRLFAAQTR